MVRILNANKNGHVVSCPADQENFTKSKVSYFRAFSIAFSQQSHFARSAVMSNLQQYNCTNVISFLFVISSSKFSERTWFHILKLAGNFQPGDVVNRQPGRVLRDRLRTLDRKDIDCLLCLVRQNPDYFLDEFMHMLKTNRIISDCPLHDRLQSSASFHQVT